MCLAVFGLWAGPVQGERILDLSFWPADQTEIALGGLWEFHAQKLLDPVERHTPSEFLVDISDSWTDFRPERASYVRLIRGLTPREAGYSVNVPAADTGMRLIIAPRYAPEEKQVAAASGFTGFWALFASLRTAPLHLTFKPKAVDEIWLLIVQRFTSPAGRAQAIPRLSVAEGSRASHPENQRSK